MHNSNDQRKHWYCFSYIGECLETGKNANASTYTGYKSKGVTKAIIDENVSNAGLRKGAVLIAVSYLGHMERSEFLAETDE